MIDANGQYYLHANGCLIYKRLGIDDPESTFVRRIWSIKDISKTPEDYLMFLFQAKKSGANQSDINRLFKLQKLHKFIPDCNIGLGVKL